MSQEKHDLNSGLISRNIYVANRRTSIKLESELWDAFFDIAAAEGVSIHDLASGIADNKSDLASLTSAVRVFIVLYLRHTAKTYRALKARKQSDDNLEAKDCESLKVPL